jgi:taurine dioxygenase
MVLRVTPLPQSLGAVVEGLDPSHVLEAADQLRVAWREHLVLFFPQLGLDDQQLIALGGVFGTLAATSTAGDDHRSHHTRGPRREVLVLDGARKEDRANTWHTDVTFSESPPIGSLLSMQVCPTKGGDTLWSNQYAAYEALAPAMRRLVDGLDAVHGRHGITALTRKPMVTVHPETGRRALYVNRGWTTRVDGMSEIESAGLLQLLFEHAERPEFTVRWTWSPGDAALWDNRCTMHYAVNDYGDSARILHRVTIHEADAVRSPSGDR